MIQAVKTLVVSVTSAVLLTAVPTGSSAEAGTTSEVLPEVETSNPEVAIDPSLETRRGRWRWRPKRAHSTASLPDPITNLTLPSFAEDTSLTLLRSDLTALLDGAELSAESLLDAPRWLASNRTPFKLQALDDGSGWSLTPAPNWNGTLGFDLLANGTRVAFSVEVTPVNDAPLLPPMRVLRSSDDTLDPQQLLRSSRDLEGDALSLTSIHADEASFSQNEDGSWSVSSSSDSDGVIAFHYSVSDGELASSAKGVLLLGDPTASSDSITGEPHPHKRDWFHSKAEIMDKLLHREADATLPPAGQISNLNQVFSVAKHILGALQTADSSQAVIKTSEPSSDDIAELISCSKPQPAELIPLKARDLGFQHQSLSGFVSSIALRHSFSLTGHSTDGGVHNHASLNAPTHSADALDPPALLSYQLNPTP